MEWSEWEPHYERIRLEFGYALEADVRSAEILDELLAKGAHPVPDLRSVLQGEEVVIVGAAPFDATKIPSDSTIVTADGATSAILEAGQIPDCIVTDLDGRVDLQAQANAGGSALVVHAHGDNIASISEHVPSFTGGVLGTCQSKPFGRLANFGGFTDGDRACFVAEHFGAASLALIGFDFDHPAEKEGKSAETKAKKLKWARALIGDVRIPVRYI